MKKYLFLGVSSLVLLSGLMTSCADETGGSTGPTSSPDSSISTSSYPDCTISLNHTSLTMNQGDTSTLRASIYGDLEDFTALFTVDDPSIVSISTTSATTSVVITGLKTGTTTITATAVSNPDISATCEVTVTEARPTPAALFENLNTIRNYTLTSKVSGPEDDHYWETYLTDRTLISYQSLDDGREFPAWVGFDSEGEIINDASSFGIFVDEAGYAAYISYETDFDEEGDLVIGDFITPGRIVSDNGGFLSADDFDGRGVARPTDADHLYASLSCIDSSYLPDEKSRDNTYEIAGTEDDTDYDLVYAEYGLLKVFANDILQDVIQSVASGGTYYLYDVTEAVDTTMRVLSGDSFEITITWDDYTITGSISNVGTTELEDASLIPDLEEDISGVTAHIPALSTDLRNIAEAFKKDNYVQEVTQYIRSGDGYVKTHYEMYYTDEYLIQYYPQDFVDKVNESQGTDLTPYGIFFFVKNSTVYYGSIEDDIVSEQLYPLSDYSVPSDDIRDVDFTRITYGDDIIGAEYFSRSPAFSEDDSFFYGFSSDATRIWDGDENEYHMSTSKDISITAQELVWGELIQDVESLSDVIIGVNAEYDSISDQVSAVNFTFGFGIGGGRYSVSDARYKNFGRAEDNPFDSVIKELKAGID